MFPWDFPGGPAVKTLPCNIGVWVRSLVGELKIPHAAGCCQKEKKNVHLIG